MRVRQAISWCEPCFQMFFPLADETFHGGNPLLPALEGQSAMKNTVLIAAGLVIGSTVRQRPTPRSSGAWRTTGNDSLV